MIEDSTQTPQPSKPKDPFDEVREWQQNDAVESARRLADETKLQDDELARQQRRRNNRDTVIAVGSILAAGAVLGPLTAYAAENTAQHNADVGQTAIDQQNASDAKRSFEEGLDNGKVAIDVSTPTPTPEVTTISAPEQIDPNLQLPTLASPDTH
jgi:hypothetical protein